MTIIWEVFVALVADNLLGKYSQYYVSEKILLRGTPDEEEK